MAHQNGAFGRRAQEAYCWLPHGLEKSQYKSSYIFSTTRAESPYHAPNDVELDKADGADVFRRWMLSSNAEAEGLLMAWLCGC